MADPVTAPRIPAPASKFDRLRPRLLALVLLATMPALGLTLYDALKQRHQAVEDAKAGALRIVRLAAMGQRQHLEASRQLLMTLTQLPEVRRGEQADCEALFTNLLHLHRVYANLGIIDPQGHLFVSALPATNRLYLGDRSYFQRARDTLKFSVGEYQIGRITHKATVNVAYPIRDRSAGTFLGVIYAALDLNWLGQVVARADLPENSTVSVVDRKGVLLAHYPDREKKWMGTAVADHAGVMAVIQNNKEVTGKGRGVDGVERFHASTPLSRTEGIADAWVSVGIPTRQSLETANLLLVQNFLFLSFVSLLALLAAWYGGDWFVLRHINSLVAAIRRLTAGDLGARTGARYDAGEIGQLARGFDEMAAALEQRVAERQRAQAALKTLNEELEQRVTDRTRELKRSNEELEQFAYVASHDLQEPLRMVTSYLQLLQQRYAAKLDRNAEEFMGFALEGSTRMQALIQDLLVYSRVGTQRKPHESTDCNLILDRSLNNLKVAVEESGAIVERGPLPTIKGDPIQLTQLFQNLIGNAIKFRGDPPPRIQIQAGRKAEEWQFEVRDNGIGIAPQDFERVFIIFQRLHRRDKYPGTGIGLSICKKIVECHGGRIWVESTPGRGTTFFFTLPAVA